MSGRLPNYLIVGAPRCGTTSLALWLAEHPDVFMSEPKELHFFGKAEHWSRGVEWYMEQFSNAGHEGAVGEGTPNYMLPSPSVERMAQVLPGDLRLIACLREPVARAYSNWQLHRSMDIEPRPFRQAIEEELAAARDPLEVPWRTWRDAPGIGMDYVARGQYLPQLERLCSIWGRERLHVVLFDDIGRDPAAVFAGVCRFLEVDDGFRPATLGKVFNSFRSMRPRRRDRVVARLPGRMREPLRQRLGADRQGGYEPMPDDVRERLVAHFVPGNAGLGAWLGRDLSPWDRGEPVPGPAGASVA